MFINSKLDQLHPRPMFSDMFDHCIIVGIIKHIRRLPVHGILMSYTYCQLAVNSNAWIDGGISSRSEVTPVVFIVHCFH